MKRVLQYLFLGPLSTLPLEIWWGTAHICSDLSRSKGEKCRWPVPGTEEQWRILTSAQIAGVAFGIRSPSIDEGKQAKALPR